MKAALTVLAVVVGLGLVVLLRPANEQVALSVKIPELSATAQVGADLFDRNCAVCHGKNAAGTDKGPPLIHKIYESGHHSDVSFYRAAEYGVRAHHWNFGNMPRVAAVQKDDVTKIIAYIREVQRANGIQ